MAFFLPHRRAYAFCARAVHLSMTIEIMVVRLMLSRCVIGATARLVAAYSLSTQQRRR